MMLLHPDITFYLACTTIDPGIGKGLAHSCLHIRQVAQLSDMNLVLCCRPSDEVYAQIDEDWKTQEEVLNMLRSN